MKNFSKNQLIAVSAFLEKWDRGYLYDELMHELFHQSALVKIKEELGTCNQRNVKKLIDDLHSKLKEEL